MREGEDEEVFSHDEEAGFRGPSSVRWEMALGGGLGAIFGGGLGAIFCRGSGGATKRGAGTTFPGLILTGLTFTGLTLIGLGALTFTGLGALTFTGFEALEEPRPTLRPGMVGGLRGDGGNRGMSWATYKSFTRPELIR